MTKLTAVLDIECYRDYFLVKLKRIDTGAIREYEIYDDHIGDFSELKRILLAYRIVTFNGTNYDMPMLAYALQLLKQSTLSPLDICKLLKIASDAIIVGNLRSWQFEQQFECKVSQNIDHVDLCEVAPGVMVSLKQYGGRMHSRKLQDLPIDPSACILPEQRPLMRDYCGNDLDTTIDLWNALTEGEHNEISIREKISIEVQTDLRSKSGAQVAEAVIRKQVEKLKCQKIYKPNIAPGTTFSYKPPVFLVFESPQLQAILNSVRSAAFILKTDGKIADPSELKGLKLTIGSTTYAMGIGGLHSCEKSVTHVADADTLLIDRDVTSFYPMLIKQCGLSPVNMGAHFQTVYRDFIARRIDAKRVKNINVSNTLKLTLNSAFGKMGSQYSVLFAPDLLIQVTLTGQLVLLMMIERLEKAGIPVVSANTDGIVIKCPKVLEQKLMEIITKWEKETGFETEETRYRALCSRDVNNYIALKENGGYKSKGTFTSPGLQKNPQHEICNIAAAKFLESGTPIAETVFGCKDIRKFITVRGVTGGGRQPTSRKMVDDWVEVSDRHWARKSDIDAGKDYHKGCVKRKSRPPAVEVTETSTYLGKVVRWYVGVHSTTHIECVRDGSKVAGSDGAVPVMELPESLPTDINYEWYIREANNILVDVGAIK